MAREHRQNAIQCLNGITTDVEQHYSNYRQESHINLYIHLFVSYATFYTSCARILNFWRVFYLFLDLVILPYFKAISIDFYAVKCLIYIYFV